MEIYTLAHLSGSAMAICHAKQYNAAIHSAQRGAAFGTPLVKAQIQNASRPVPSVHKFASYCKYVNLLQGLVKLRGFPAMLLRSLDNCVLVKSIPDRKQISSLLTRPAFTLTQSEHTLVPLPINEI
jgi:hypothetical protein